MTHSHSTDTMQDLDAGLTAEDDYMSVLAELEAEEAAEAAAEAEAGDDLTGALETSHAASLLDELMKPAAAPGDFSLDDLLNESMEAVNASAAVKAGRKRLRDSNVGSKERGQIEETIRLWELEREWRPAATVVMFQTQTCTCVTAQSIFAGLFQRQAHRTSKIDRWVQVPEGLDPALPKEIKHADSDTAICLNCVTNHGFSHSRQQVAA